MKWEQRSLRGVGTLRTTIACHCHIQVWPQTADSDHCEQHCKFYALKLTRPESTRGRGPRGGRLRGRVRAEGRGEGRGQEPGCGAGRPGKRVAVSEQTRPGGRRCEPAAHSWSAAGRSAGGPSDRKGRHGRQLGRARTTPGCSELRTRASP